MKRIYLQSIEVTTTLVHSSVGLVEVPVSIDVEAKVSVPSVTGDITIKVRLNQHQQGGVEAICLEAVQEMLRNAEMRG
jgi:hypothetical protein